ncbi:hypothetical protein [Flavobacterium proteolyticum]|uniref:Uncharacterized protein n=1 Tax=Flavobacterium proteolyticum TaxID=2911683 RepID=A0ABR9WNY3_9FLAO|nr:hypothetical protein [Flavobacterium proteolyticum]MBE9575630.1 hypothetical protein [Flavobacterium proteolyticum]
MKRIILILLFCSFYGFSQDIKLKKGIVTVDNVNWLKYDGCGGWDQVCTVYNLSGEEIIYMKLLSKPDTADQKYWKVNFLGVNKSVDLDFSEGFGLINGKLLKKFYDAKVVNEDGTLNEERVQRMVEKYGTPFTDKANASSTTIIINNNNDQTPKRSGVNINIGG